MRVEGNEVIHKLTRKIKYDRRIVRTLEGERGMDLIKNSVCVSQK